MDSWIRGRDILLKPRASASELWQKIEALVIDRTGTGPFDSEAYTHSNYLPSGGRTAGFEFEIAKHHARYQAEPGGAESQAASDELLGQVEKEILGFARTPQPMLTVLVGSMGSGKSTTINYLKEHYLVDYKVVLCDFDKDLRIGPAVAASSEGDVAAVLVSHVSTKMNHLIPADEEIRGLWTWGLSNEDDANHPAKYSLSDAADELRQKLEKEWLSESPEALAIRKQCLEEIRRDPVKHLNYQALRIDYYLTCICKEDRRKFMLILDNIDPLPPRIQFQMLDLAGRIQSSARCKVLVSIRPLTYSSNLQRAHRILWIIEHKGPTVIDLVVHRINNLILRSELPEFSMRIQEDNRGERLVNQDDARRWVEEILKALSRERRQVGIPGEPDARTFIEGICGYSLRGALIVASKVFGSSVIPVIDTLDGDAARPHRQRVRDHDIIRAVLEGLHGYFFARSSRVTDNLFDLGTEVSSRSCTCKVRLLKKLLASNNGIAPLGEVRTHLLRFGYDDETVRDAINSVIAQSKQLAWSDSVAHYATLDGYQSTRLQISRAGKFYVEYAMFNLEYIQAVHIDVLLPREETLEHDPRNFADRLRSLELFIRYLYKQDQQEIKRLLLNSAAADYNAVYDARLFSVDIITALERQVKNISQSMLKPGAKLSAEKRAEINEAAKRWEDLSRSVEYECQDLIKKLKQMSVHY